MLDIKKIRKFPEYFERHLLKRGINVDINKILNLDANWREKIDQLQQLRSLRKKTSDIINKKKQAKEQCEEDIKNVRIFSQDIKLLDQSLEVIKKELENILLNLPNLPSEQTPEGKNSDDNIEIRSWGTKKNFSFKPKAHWELGTDLDILDLISGAKITGSGFPVYKGQGAKLERALINYFLDFHSQQSYEEYYIPFIVNREAIQGTGQLPKFENDTYHIPNDDLFLIPTAEVPLTNLYKDIPLMQQELPKYLMAFSPCFRREAGASGKDNRGIARIHQFNKVELVKLVNPQDSMLELETLLADVEHLLQSLGLHYRIVELCTGDLGFSASRCYDIEVWSPATQKYLEVSSCSNFLDFQSRRCNLKYREKKSNKLQFLHTLNGSGLALPRCVIALLETYQQENGSIVLPDILAPYIDINIKKEKNYYE